MENCIFCKIVKDEIPSHKIYENEHILVFLDISQTTKGHTLIIPKVHSVDIFDTNEDTFVQIAKVIPKISSTLKMAFNCEGINIVNNSGIAAGQTVFHTHVHLIPRYNRDKFNINFVNNMSKYDTQSLSEIKNKIIEKLK